LVTNKVVFPPSLPDWLFDRSAYASRVKAGDPDYLSQLLDAAP